MSSSVLRKLLLFVRAVHAVIISVTPPDRVSMAVEEQLKALGADAVADASIGVGVLRVSGQALGTLRGRAGRGGVVADKKSILICIIEIVCKISYVVIVIINQERPPTPYRHYHHQTPIT